MGRRGDGRRSVFIRDSGKNPTDAGDLCEIEIEQLERDNLVRSGNGLLHRYGVHRDAEARVPRTTMVLMLGILFLLLTRCRFDGRMVVASRHVEVRRFVLAFRVSRTASHAQ